MPLFKPKKLLWTHHAREKMGYYRLSEQRVRSVLNSPRRVEEGVAPKTIAAMAPVSLRSAQTKTGSIIGPSFRKPLIKETSNGKPTWSQEIWVMVQDVPSGRKIISAWRYPGVSKVRGEITDIMKSEYSSYINKK